jgi:hypothetical protein
MIIDGASPHLEFSGHKSRRHVLEAFQPVIGQGDAAASRHSRDPGRNSAPEGRWPVEEFPLFDHR